MPLRHRFLYHNLLLVIGLIAVGTIAVWRLSSLRGEVNPSPTVYAELRTITAVASEAGQVRGLLSQPVDNHDQIIAHLRYAIGGLDQFIQLGNVYGSASVQGSADQSGSIFNAANAARSKLQGVLDHLSNAPRDATSTSVATVDDAMKDLDQVATSCTRFMSTRQQTASSHLALNLILIGALSLAAVLAAVIVSVMHDRLVVTPLQRLREGVNAVAAARFTQKLDLHDVTNAPEFLDLSGEFNRMADELDGFYRRLEEQVRAKSRELVRSERLASVGFLAAGVAHEINNPLNIISGYAELTLRQLDPSRITDSNQTHQDIRQSVRMIRDEAFRCKEITEKLLSLSRGGKDARERLDLSGVAREVASMTSGLRDYRDRRLVLRFDREPLEVEANLTEMKQVLLNLMINALESTEATGGEVCIEGHRTHDWVELSVNDNGRGMEPEVLRHVFEPFFTARGNNGRRGTGLGLSITHAIVENHGGRIHAESSGTGHGARFVVRLPAHGTAEPALGN
jgi:signal transduction histidine kinase